MPHKGRLWPRIKRLDWGFPLFPHEVPPRIWIVQGVTLTGTQVSIFPPQPWEVGLTMVSNDMPFAGWTTNLATVGLKTASVAITLGLLPPPNWCGIAISCSITTVGGANTVTFEPCPNTFDGITFSSLFASTNPPAISMTSGGVARPKLW